MSSLVSDSVVSKIPPSFGSVFIMVVSLIAGIWSLSIYIELAIGESFLPIVPEKFLNLVNIFDDDNFTLCPPYFTLILSDFSPKIVAIIF